MNVFKCPLVNTSMQIYFIFLLWLYSFVVSVWEYSFYVKRNCLLVNVLIIPVKLVIPIKSIKPVRGSLLHAAKD